MRICENRAQRSFVHGAGTLLRDDLVVGRLLDLRTHGTLKTPAGAPWFQPGPSTPAKANAAPPGYRPTLPSCSSIAINRLYFSTRSLRERDPVLICPAPVATAMSAIVVSPVSPERCEITQRYPALCASSTASSVS